jgi:endonuclease/exonuclease/phosphatase family metal-dependent hydrolase
VRVRAVTFNIASFRAGRDAATALLRDLAPDLLLLQECGSGRRALRLAKELGMDGVTSHRPFNRVRNAVLFRPPWRLEALEVRNLTRQGRSLRRGFIAAHLRQPSVRLTAVSVHLGLVQREREAHARALTDFLSGVDGPVVIGADLNEGPQGMAARWMSERFYDAFTTAGEGPGETFPARVPTARIDFVFVGESGDIRKAWVPEDNEPASDHRPVVADVEFEGP